MEEGKGRKRNLEYGMAEVPLRGEAGGLMMCISDVEKIDCPSDTNEHQAACLQANFCPAIKTVRVCASFFSLVIDSIV